VESHSHSHSLGSALALYFAGVILVVTLVPLHFRLPAELVLTGFVSLSDLIANVALFVPLGFLLAFGGVPRPLVLGFLLSAAIEICQEFIPGRFPSLLDVATNALGAGIGALAFGLLRRALARGASPIGVLALDLPLAGLVYLLVPLLWLTGLAGGGDGDQRWLAALIGLTGAIALAAIDRHLLAPRGTSRWAVPVAAGLWFGVGLLPGWYAHLGTILVGIAAIAGLTGLLAALLGSIEPAGRRYELTAVRRAGAALAIFIGAVAIWPVNGVGRSWWGGLGFGWGRDAAELPMLRFLELVAAVTVAGYAVAEARGRTVEREARSRRVIWVVGAGLGLAIAVLRGFHPAYGASALEVVVLAGATRFGALVYWRQRAFVRALLGRPAGDSATASVPRARSATAPRSGDRAPIPR
jgi:hypothetical protein